MAQRRKTVFDKERSPDRLPDWASEGVVVLEWMQQRGTWQEAEKRLNVQREGGYCGIDILLFLVYYFASGLRCGLKKFGEHTKGHRQRLAAVAERRQLSTPASMSRGLFAVNAEANEELGPWLLLEAPGVEQVLQHPSVQSRDALGQGWHVFDWDPTMTVLRHRALPEMEDLPEGKRRSAALAKPGYPGRKRGDVQLSRALLQHAGSGLWVHLQLGPGNGEARAAYKAALQAIPAVCEKAHAPLARAVIRSDGVGGNVPFITECNETQIHYATRLVRYEILSQPEVIDHLNQATWYAVPCSGSGPARQAAELGTMVLEPSLASRREDGRRYAPVQTRVVVSRFRREDKHGAGVWIDGWQYELFGTDLDPQAWPTAEVVTFFFGRCGQENRFSQEDRELCLDRIFSYHLPGQELANLIGLFVWNFQICRGMELACPPCEPPEQPVSNLESVTPEVMLTVQRKEATAPPAPTAEPASSPSVAPLKPAEPNSAQSFAEAPAQNLFDELERFDWPTILAARPGWRFDRTQGGLRCPNDRTLSLPTLVQTGRLPGTFSLRFRALEGSCEGCPYLTRCAPKATVDAFTKQLSVLVPPELTDSLCELTTEAKRAERRARAKSAASAKSKQRRVATAVKGRKKPLSWQPPAADLQPGSLQVMCAILLPAVLRKLFLAACGELETHVQLTVPPEAPKPVPAYAMTPAERQHRRLSWTQRNGWNKLPDDTQVLIELRNGKSVVPLFSAQAERCKEA